MNDLLILYGIRNGLTDPQIAVLASFMHLTMPFMVLGKQLIPRYGLSKTWGGAWFLRYLSGAVLILAPWIGRVAPQWIVVGVVWLGAFGFSLFRSIGLTANSALTGEITTSRDRGRFISGNWMRAQTGNLLAMIVVILVMRYYSQLWVYQILIGFGCLVGLYGATLLMKVPESVGPSISARKPVLESLRISFSKARYRRTLYAWSAGLSAYVLVIPFSIVLIKNGYGISDANALLFSLILLIGGITAALVNSALADRVGPRPLLLIYMAGFFVVAAYWIMAPDTFHPVPVALSFFLAGLCKTGINVGASHYLLAAVEPQDRVGISMFARMFSGAAAGLAGSVVGASILTILRGMDMTGLPLYRSYFLVIGLILIPLYALILRLDRLKEWRVGSVLTLLFSMRDLRALYVMNRLERSRDAEDDVAYVQRLRQIASSLSESTLRGLLDSPRLAVRVHAMRALREIEFGAQTADALINEVRCGEFTSAWNAAEILGEHRVQQAVPVLREGLESADPFLVGKCMVSLVQLGDSESYERIRELFAGADNPRIIIHGANAFVAAGDPARITDLLEKIYHAELYPPVADELLSAVATLCGCEREFYRFLREYNRDPEQGISMLQSDLEELTGERYTSNDVYTRLKPSDLMTLMSDKVQGDSCAAYFEDFFKTSKKRLRNETLHLKLLACLATIFVSSFSSDIAGYSEV